MAVETARILRALPPALAEQMLRTHGCELDTVDISTLTRLASLARWVAAIEVSSARPHIEQILADVDMMSDWLGEACLREAVRDEAPDLFDALMRGEGAHERAAFAQLQNTSVFGRARRRRYFSHYRLSRKACARFRAPTLPDWRPSQDVIDELLLVLAPMLEEQLRTGQRIIADPIVRNAGGSGACVQLSLYAAGVAQRIEEVEGDDLVPKVIRPAFACVIGYWPKTGGLEIVVRNGTFNLRAAIAQAFAQSALGASPDALESMAEPTITLDGLLARPILDFEPDGGIVAARLMELEVRSMAQPGVSVTLAARDKNSDAWTASDAFVKDSALLAGIAMSAKIRIEYKIETGGRRRTVTFDLSPPHGYKPRGATDMERLVIEKYLPRWGLLVAEEAPTWT